MKEAMAAEGSTIHSPAGEECLKCHVPHASTNPSLQAKSQPALCVGCHDVKSPALRKAHLEIDLSRSTCSSCHDPHSSSDAKLINAVRHKPFEARNCSACHEVKR